MKKAICTSFALLILAAATSAWAGDCDTKAKAAKTVKGFDATMDKMKLKQQKHEAAAQAEIDAIARQMVESKRWTKEQGGAFYARQMQSQEFNGLERQKMAIFKVYVKDTQSFVEQQQKGDASKACPFAVKMLESLTSISELNDKQYTGMLASAKKAAGH